MYNRICYFKNGSPMYFLTRVFPFFIFSIMDGVQESCHCNDSSVCITSVQCVDLLLTSLEELTQGADIDEDLAREIHIQYQQLEKGIYQCIKNISKLLIHTS